jgi:hypothetical protein
MIVAMAVVGIFCGPLQADVIPSRRAETADSTQKVQGRLMQLGLSQDQALGQTQQLTDHEAAYFAQNTDRVQIVGQQPFGGQTDLLWWELVFGAAALIGAVYLVYYETAGRD